MHFNIWYQINSEWVFYRSVKKNSRANFEETVYTYIKEHAGIVISCVYPEWMNRISLDRKYHMVKDPSYSSAGTVLVLV